MLFIRIYTRFFFLHSKTQIYSSIFCTLRFIMYSLTQTSFYSLKSKFAPVPFSFLLSLFLFFSFFCSLSLSLLSSCLFLPFLLQLHWPIDHESEHEIKSNSSPHTSEDTTRATNGRGRGREASSTLRPCKLLQASPLSLHFNGLLHTMVKLNFHSLSHSTLLLFLHVQVLRVCSGEWSEIMVAQCFRVSLPFLTLFVYMCVCVIYYVACKYTHTHTLSLSPSSRRAMFFCVSCDRWVQ